MAGESALAGHERLTVTLPAADATLETEGAVETGCPQRLYGTVTRAAILTDHQHPALLLDAPFLAFGQISRRHVHGFDDMPCIEAGLVADVDHRRAPVDHAHRLYSRYLQQGPCAKLYFNRNDRDRHEQCRHHQKRVGGYEFEESVHSA
ncbi:MAG: hypothetical protein QG595_203 [Pseudomonadota bacterium]|nr:hypothetical protein [Pseudomonadota bacterium]